MRLFLICFILIGFTILTVTAAWECGRGAVHAFVELPKRTRRIRRIRETTAPDDPAPYTWRRRPLFGVTLALAALILIALVALTVWAVVWVTLHTPG